jgi:hypothetical protein|eukprot:COSAG06_NODE_1542_length_9143_cov_6.740380_7_plen_68_part_00
MVVIFNHSCSIRIGRWVNDKLDPRLFRAYGVSKCLTIFSPSVDEAYGIYTARPSNCDHDQPRCFAIM